ncbi:MAG: hypothetical protein EZS28_019054 [Streblomastix strix]|uniref:Uncharacterized protein n=1 Tax=Streblomastix strix TaxID=222440 RepID=A0A5J4VS58_9EUKA|nr:MAG: hypothetical protein EZS28_019054 [Streblomastix strix]
MGNQSILEQNVINQTRDTIVARQITQTNDIIPPPIPNNNLTNYRCIPFKLWGDIGEGQFFDKIEGRLGISCDTITEQERTTRSTGADQIKNKTQIIIEPRRSSSVLRQHDNCGNIKQTHYKQLTTYDLIRTSNNNEKLQFTSFGFTHSRNSENSSRQTLTIRKHIGFSASTSNIQQLMRITTNQTRSRPFRVNMEYTATNFLFLNPRNEQFRNQFNNSKLETIQSSKCIPTTTVNYIDTSKNTTGQPYCIDNYTSMASSHLDPATLKNERFQEDQSGLVQFNYQIRPCVQTIPNTITSRYTRSLTDQVVKQRIQEILDSVGTKSGSLMIASLEESTWSSYKGVLAS